MSPEVYTLVGSVLVSFIIAVVGPYILFSRQAKQRAEERKQDNARADEIAERVAKVAKEVTTATQETAASLGEIKSVADVTHNLVNSNMDEEKRRRLESAHRELATLLELAALRKSMQQEPTPEALAAVENARTIIAELEVELVDRAKSLATSEGGV